MRFKLQHGSEIFRLATPTVVTMLSMTLMWTVDTALLGRVSSLAQGAAGLGGIIGWTLYSLFNNLSRINATFVSQANGRGDDRAIGDYTWQSTYLALAAGLLLTLVCWHSDLFLWWTGNGPAVEDATHRYLKLRGLSAVGNQLAFCLAGFFQGRKDVTTPMWAGIVANVVNVVLDVMLIFGVSSLGIAASGLDGAAIATSVATWVQALFLLAATLLPAAHRARYLIHVPRPPHAGQLRDLLRVGMPASVQGFLDMVFFAVFTSIVGRAGVASLAASQIVVQLLSFSFMPLYGLSQAVSVLVGNALGEKNPDKAGRYARETYLVALAYLAPCALLLLGFGSYLFRLFSVDPEVLALAGGLATAAAVFQIFDGLQIVGNGVMTGGGDTRFPMIYSMGVVWLVAVPLVTAMNALGHGQVVELWAAASLCYALIALGFYLRVRGGQFKRVDIFGTAR
ncbi:MAG: MATE family efflux transporter [Pseudomonadota bacterium]